MKKKVILSAVLSIVLCLSVITGSTMALFTSESKVNIAVSSGKVSVTASVSNFKIYSMGEEQTGTFANGGTAAYDEATSTLALSGVTPGDKVELTVDVKNDSNVAINYRVQTFIKGALGSYLKTTATIGGVAQEIKTNTSAWKFVTAGAAIDSIPVTVELPEDAENGAQDKTAVITIGIQAVQANGTEALIPEGLRATPTTINAVMDGAAEGDTIALTAGYYEEIVVAKSGLSFVGEDGAVVGHMNFNAKTACKVENVTFDASGAKKAFIEHNSTYGFYANIVGSGDSEFAAHDLKIVNCIFTGAPVDPDGYAPIALYERGRSNGALKNLTVTGCTFETDAAYYVYGAYLGVGTQTITNNVFGTEDTTVASGSAVYLGSNQSSVVMTGNTFVNSSYTGTIHSATYNYVTVTVENNDYVITSAGDFTLAALRYYTSYGATVSVKNNTVNGAAAATKTPYVVSGYECFDVTVS